MAKTTKTPDAEVLRAREAELTKNLEFMEKKLDKARSILEDAELLEPGVLAGQVSVNNAFDAFKSLLNSYCRTLAELRQVLANKGTTEPETPKESKLAQFQGKYSKGPNRFPRQVS